MGSILGSNDTLPEKMAQIQDNDGHIGHAQECRRLTDLFESQHVDENWFEKDWYETIDTFIQENL